MTTEKDREPDRMCKRVFLSRVAKRSGVKLVTVKAVYSAMVDELLDVVRRGDSLMLTSFGKFYPQPHHGHRVQFAKDRKGDPKVIEDYMVLKFSATRDVNRSLSESAAVREALGRD